MAARPPSDVFRPCLPFDPFAGVEPGPWKPSISPHADPPNAVLVLGDPAPADLLPVLFSPSLAHSLVVVATHAPPHIPHTPIAAVRVLRLTSPLAQEAGALRLVGLLERAERVVRRFRANGSESSRKLVQLAENKKTGEFDVEEVYSAAEPPSPSRTRSGSGQEVITRYPSPAPSAASSISSSSSAFSNSSSSASSSFSRRRRARVGGVDGGSSSRPATERAFDAIINFLPSSLPDKFLLKNAILISTLSASFVAAPPAPLFLGTPSAKSKQRSSIFSTFSSSDATADAKKNPRRFPAFLGRPSTSPRSNAAYVHSAPCSHDELPLSSSSMKGKSRSQINLHQHHSFHRRAHLIHILPPHVYHHTRPTSMGASGSFKKPQQKSSSKFKPKPKLVQSIEQFLLAFGYPLQSMSLLPSASPSPPGSRRISATSTMTSGFMSASPSASAFGAGYGIERAEEKPVPFLLPPGVFGSTPSGGRLSIGEILLLGGLDSAGNGAPVEGVDQTDVVGMGLEEGRVWIGSPDDVVWGDDDLTGGLSISHTYSNSREVAFAIPTSYQLQPPPQVRSHPTRQNSAHIAPLTASSHFHPQSPSDLHSASLPVLAPSSPPSARQLPLPPPARLASFSGTGTGSPTPNSPLRPHRTSYTFPVPTSAEIISQKQEQLPTPPESASSLEDGDDDIATVESAETTTYSLHDYTSGTAASTADHHHYGHQEAKNHVHYVKAAASVGRSVSLRTPDVGAKKGGFMARFGFGKLWGVKSSASNVGRT